MIRLLHKPRVGISALFLSLGLSTMAYAQSTSADLPMDGAQVGQEVEELNLEQLLSQIQLASSRVNYQGVFVSHWANQNLVTSGITNIFNNDQLSRRVESLDDSPIEVLRTGEQQIQLIPDKQIAISTPIREHDFPGLLLTKATGISNYYFAHELNAPARVAGIECKKILLEPRDDNRYGFRLCVEPIKRLLLQIETVNPKQQIISQTTFTHLLLDDQVDPESVHTAHDYVNWTHLKPSSDEVDLEAEGWQFSLPSGFQKVTSFKLVMGTKKEVRQLTLSDGLSSFSLFVQELAEQDKEQYGHSDQVEGSVNIYSRRLGNYWLTALGAMPLPTLEAVAESAKHSSIVD
ncbi:MAG: MucB/RseB C-terminal domain-containing protein [Alcaligenaceae bacterium]|nr:MucB/RseB C-terminal domain-containing protein [Alcaligenaceae bacterium]